MPEVSIIVPVYNAEKYLPRCIKSMKEQTFQNFEVILVNDGSTDSSLNICRKAAEDDSRFLVFDKPNEGPGLTREYGIDMSRGKYIFFVDSDDYIDSVCIERMLEKLITDAVDLVRCNAFNPTVLSPGLPIAHTFTSTGTSSPSL